MYNFFYQIYGLQIYFSHSVSYIFISQHGLLKRKCFLSYQVLLSVFNNLCFLCNSLVYGDTAYYAIFYEFHSLAFTFISIIHLG